MNENWRPVVGYEGSYEVSDLGTIRSLDRVIEQCGGARKITRSLKGRVLKQGVTNDGRMKIQLGANSRTRLVHQLVVEAFIGPRQPGMEVAHRDGDCKNNKLTNLRWATRAENVIDDHINGIRDGERNSASKLSEIEVRLIRRLPANVTLREISADYGISIGNAHKIRTGKNWAHLVGV